MTAIATISMTIATIAIAVIGLQAKNTWKTETKARKIFEINKKYLEEIEKLEILLSAFELIGDEDETKKLLKERYDGLNQVLYEYTLIEKNRETEFLRNLLYFKLTIDKYVSRKFKTANGKLQFYYESFWDDYTPILNNETGDIVYTQEYNDLLEKLNNAKSLCENNIHRFYN